MRPLLEGLWAVLPRYPPSLSRYPPYLSMCPMYLPLSVSLSPIPSFSFLCLDNPLHISLQCHTPSVPLSPKMFAKTLRAQPARAQNYDFKSPTYEKRKLIRELSGEGFHVNIHLKSPSTPPRPPKRPIPATQAGSTHASRPLLEGLLPALPPPPRPGAQGAETWARVEKGSM